MKLSIFWLIFFFLAASNCAKVTHRDLLSINFVESISKIGKQQYQSTQQYHFNSFLKSIFNVAAIFETAKFNFNVSQKCSQQFHEFQWALEQGESWPLEVIDAWGKPPSGIMLNGNFLWYGEFSGCRNISALNGTWKGKYTLIATPIDPLSFFKMNESNPLKYGACFPNQCSQQDVFEILTNVLNPLPFKIDPDVSYVQFQGDEKKLNRDAIILLSFLGLIVGIVLVGTLFDFYKRFMHHKVNNAAIHLNDSESNGSLMESDLIDSETTYHVRIAQERMFVQLLVSVSAYTNTKKLFTINVSNEQFKCLDGIRVLSLAWVILGHTYAFVVSFSDNLFIVPSYIQRFSFLVISNGFFSVDTFFLLSGLLTCYTFLRIAERHDNKISIGFMAKYYIHRLWRCTPSYYIAMSISIYLSAYFGSGPLYPPQGFEPVSCRKMWWINALYLNNLFLDEKEMCFGVSWFLACDMQMHWFAPILVVPLALGKVTFALNLAAFLLLACSVSIGTTLYYYRDIHMDAAQYGKAFGQFFNEFYILPWNRVGPFVVGILTGYLIFLYKKKILTLSLSKRLNVTLWVVSLGMSLLLVFGLYPDAKGLHPLSQGVRIAYQSFCKIMWSLSVAYMICACVTSQGGWINRLLSWSIWAPLSKLTYAAFLTHVAFIIYLYATREHGIHVSDATMIMLFSTNFVASYCIAYFFYVFFEVPFIGLEKFMFRR
jgi:peptidoglycan/LPS O-acetylase OafA/YrhL